MYVQGLDRPEWPGPDDAENICNAELEPFFPRRVCICMKQGEGPAAVPVVAPGEHVLCGQLIGKNASGLCVPVYASVSGTVAEIRQQRHSAGEMVSYVVIERDGAQGFVSLPQGDQSLYALRRMGIIGMLEKRRPVFLAGFYRGRLQKLCLAAFDREPMVCSDYRLLMECPAKVLLGARVMAEMFQLKELHIYVCHEEVRYILEKTAAVYFNALKPLEHIRYFKVADTMYEKSCAPLRAMDDGLWCSCVELGAAYDGFYDGRPMTGRGVTVCGRLKKQRNLWVPNGTYVRDLLEYCGGIAGGKSYVNTALMEEESLCAVEGGPLGGHCVDVDHACVSLTTESLMVLPIGGGRETDCLMCRDCSAVCPVGLKPLYIERAFDGGAGPGFLADAGRCVECGWCSYVCPSNRRLKEKIRAAKKQPPRLREPRTEMARELWDYIDLDMDDAAALESLVPVSQSGPYIHSRRTAGVIAGRLLWIAGIMGMIYMAVLGPEILLKYAVFSFAFAADTWICEKRRDGGRGLLKSFREGSGTFSPAVKKALADGLIVGMALCAPLSWKWILVCAAVALAVRHTLNISPVLAGIAVSLCAGFFAGVPEPSGSLWIVLGWMAVWLYMIGDMLIVPWPTVFFLLVFQWLYTVFGGAPLWDPAVFMGAVWFVNDYKNAGKDTAMHGVLAAFSGGLCALLAIVFSGGAGVFSGLLVMHIIACNLTADTI